MAQSKRRFDHEFIVNLCWHYCESHFGILRDDHTDTSAFFEEFLSDPLDHVEMISFVEDTFHVDPTDDEMYAVQTFLDLIQLIERKMS